MKAPIERAFLIALCNAVHELDPFNIVFFCLVIGFGELVQSQIQGVYCSRMHQALNVKFKLNFQKSVYAFVRACMCV